MKFEKEWEERLKEVNEIVLGYLPPEEGFQKTVLCAMNYSLRAGGKRLRPMLMQETFRLFGGSGRVVEPFMAAMEMIHTYSLIHDDLPALDNDDYRRGKKTTHIVYGEAMAILAGDGLLNYAYETALGAFSIEPDHPRIVQALSLLSSAAGVYGMLGGQSVDVETCGRPTGLEQLEFVYRLKTGALIEASMMIGGVLAGASGQEMETVRRVAADVGLAFQIQDDILDVESSAQELGKPVHSDERNQKTTYVTLLGITKAKQEVRDRSDRAVRELQSMGRQDPFLEWLLLQLTDRKN